MDEHVKAHFAGHEKVLWERREHLTITNPQRSASLRLEKRFQGWLLEVLRQENEGGRCRSKNTIGSLGRDRQVEGVRMERQALSFMSPDKREKNSSAICDWIFIFFWHSGTQNSPSPAGEGILRVNKASLSKKNQAWIVTRSQGSQQRCATQKRCTQHRPINHILLLYCRLMAVSIYTSWCDGCPNGSSTAMLTSPSLWKPREKNMASTHSYLLFNGLYRTKGTS